MCVAYSSDGSRVATGLNDDKITMWNAISVSRLMLLKHPGEVTSVTFLFNDTLLASGSSSNTIMLWDTISGSPIRTYGEHTKSVNCLSAFPKTSRIFASGSADCTIRIWDATSADCILTMECHESPVLSVAVLPDGSRILSGLQDGIIVLWDSTTGTELQQFELHTGAVCSLAVNDFKDLRFASASKDGVINIYSISRNVEVMMHDLEHEVHTIAFSPDGEMLAFNAPQNVLVLNCSTRQVSAKFRHQGVTQVAFSPQGTRLASGIVIFQQLRDVLNSSMSQHPLMARVGCGTLHVPLQRMIIT
jgi:WD40 repeat protein